MMKELAKAIKLAGGTRYKLSQLTGVNESTIRSATAAGRISPTLAKKIAKAVPGISAAKLCGL